MSIEVAVALLGKPSTAKEVKDLLEQGGYAKEPKPKRGDTQAWVELEKLGISLVFDGKGKGSLLLSSVEFCCDGYRETHAGFSGKLPLGVRFNQTRQQVLALLGKPEMENADLALDRWRIEGTWYFARYTDEFDRVLTFSMQIPDPS
jgi:hypothetical protein